MSRALVWSLAQNDCRLKITCLLNLTHSQNIINWINTTFKVIKTWDYPAGNYMFKVNNRNTRIRCKIRLKLTTETPERRFIYNSFKYLWWKAFAKLPISGFNLLIVSDTLQSLLACYGLFCVVPFFTSNDVTECFD